MGESDHWAVGAGMGTVGPGTTSVGGLSKGLVPPNKPTTCRGAVYVASCNVLPFGRLASANTGRTSPSLGIIEVEM